MSTNTHLTSLTNLPNRYAILLRAFSKRPDDCYASAQAMTLALT